MKNISFKFLLCGLLFIAQTVIAQDKTIIGVVTEQDGFALPGVSVTIKGTNRGVQTDLDGKFNVKVNSGDLLLFEYIGYKTEEVLINNQQNINVVLTEDAVLEDIVIVAYGTQKQRAVVGSIGQIKSETLEKQQSTSVVSALQGSVSGVNIINSSSQPGESPTIRVRGINSINASASPLIILDGSPFSGNINSISADQIETINVLKDASSTALYGSRGSNGVILIKTKNGKLNNAPKININLSTGISSNAVEPHSVLNTEEFTKYLWEGRKNKYKYLDGDDDKTASKKASDGLVNSLTYNPYGTDTPIDYEGNWVVENPLLWETDWKKELNRNQAFRREYSFNVTGGEEKTTYFLSANHLDQDGLIKTSNFKRTSMRLNIETQLKDWLHLGANTAYSTSIQNFPIQSGSTIKNTMNWLYSVPSVYPLYKRDENGEIIKYAGNPIYDYGNDGSQSVNGVRTISSGENAVGALFNDHLNYGRSNLRWNGFAKIDLSEGIYFKTNMSYEKSDLNSNEYQNSKYGQATNVKGRVRKVKNTFENLNFINTLHYERTLDLHNFTFDGIFEAYMFKSDYFNASTTGFIQGNTQIGGGTSLEKIDGYKEEDRLLSYLGRFGYDYDNKYFIEGSFRRDGSTRFAKEVRYGNFYSIGGSWIITAEDFISANTYIDLLKLRASYGELGNNNTNDLFPYSRSFLTGYNQLNNSGVILEDLKDPNLTWEKTASFNIGLDFSLFNNVLEGSVDYYKKQSIDLLYKIPQAPSIGSLSVLSNAGTIENHGLEVNLTTHNIRKKDLVWDTSLNFSIDRNKIKSLTQESFTNGMYRWEVGRSLYDFYIQEYAGVDPNDGYAMWYKDILDSEGNVTGRETTKKYESATRYYNKSALPKIIGGFNTSIKYMNFDFSALLNFSLGGYIYDNDYAYLMNGISRGAQQSSPDIKDSWKKQGDITNVPVLLYSKNDFNNISTRFLYKNNYLRVKAVSLGYNLPLADSTKLYLKQMRIYLLAENLFTFHSHKGIDPEQGLSGQTNMRAPLSTTISLGVNINF